MKKHLKKLIIGVLVGAVLIIIAVTITVILFLWKLFMIPESQYVYVSDLNDALVRYTLIYEDHILFIDIDPECEDEVQKIKSSDFYAGMEDGPEPVDPDGYMWAFCDRQSKRKMEIESVSTDGNTNTYILYYASPGEKGSHYRETLIQTPDKIIIDERLEGDRTTYEEMTDLIYSLY
ncbi:MAG: hypothetical protein WC897_04855 [Candidatus Gracilibacteria bacterium]